MEQKKIGRFIAELRNEKGLTQAELGEKLGVSDKAVSKWENGRCLPDPSLYKPLCELLNTNLIELFDGERLPEGSEVQKADSVIHALAEESEKKSVFKLISMIFSAVFIVLGVIFLFLPGLSGIDGAYYVICVSVGLLFLFLGVLINIFIWASSKNKVVKNEGIGFSGALTLIFITLKLTGNIDWPWIWVFAPLWVSALLIVLFLLVVFMIAGVKDKLAGRPVFSRREKPKSKET